MIDWIGAIGIALLVAVECAAFLISGRDGGVDGHRSWDGIHDAGGPDDAGAGSGRRWEARQNAFELLAEVVVEPGVEENVVAGGRHGDRVSQEADKAQHKKCNNTKSLEPAETVRLRGII